MATHVQHVNRRVDTRDLLDIDPKVKAVAAVAAVTVLIVAAVVAVQAATGGQVNLVEILGPTAPVLLALGAGYAKRSSHAEVIEQGIHAADEAAHVLGPIVVRTGVVAAPVVQEVEDGLDAIDAAFSTPPTQ